MLSIDKIIAAGFSAALAHEAMNHPELIPAELHESLSDGDYVAHEVETEVETAVVLPPVQILKDEPKVELPPPEA